MATRIGLVYSFCFVIFNIVFEILEGLQAIEPKRTPFLLSKLPHYFSARLVPLRQKPVNGTPISGTVISPQLLHAF